MYVAGVTWILRVDDPLSAGFSLSCQWFAADEREQIPGNYYYLRHAAYEMKLSPSNQILRCLGKSKLRNYRSTECEWFD